jgi:Ketopantoate reductase PanE/ApbA
MNEHRKPRILVIGAGSMGIIMGYILSLSGAEVTFLVRPHRAEALNRPQILYCYDDNKLKEYKGYTYFTDQSKMVGANYDYIVITLDAASLRNDVGQSLVKTIGDAARGTSTKVILGSFFLNLRPWFLQVSGLAGEQVTNGYLAIHAYPTKAVTLPLHAPTDPELLEKADLAYTDCLGPGITLDDSSPTVANEFMEIYNASGVSKCAVKPTVECAVSAHPMFAVFAACELLNWPKFQDIGAKGELWTLAVAAVKEIQRLSILGEPGQQAAKTTTEDGLAARLAAWEKGMLPFDLQEFNRFHHGSKVNAQDRELLRACISYGEADGKPMSALKDLLQQAEDHQETAR